MRARTCFSILLLIVAAGLAVACGGVSVREPEEGTVVSSPVSHDPDVDAELSAERQALAERQAEIERREAELAEAREQVLQLEQQLDRQQKRLGDRETELENRMVELDRRLDRLETATPAEVEVGVAEPQEEVSIVEAEGASEAWRERPIDRERPTPAVVGVDRAPRRVTVPAASLLTVELVDPLSSRTSREGDRFEARVTADLLVDGEVVVAAGSRVEGEILEAVAAKRVGGQARLTLAFTELAVAGGPSTPIEASHRLAGRNDKKRDAATIGGSAAAGAVLGRVLDDDDRGRGTLVGAVVGAAAGAAVAARRGEEVELEPGTVFTLELERAVHLVIDPTPRSRNQ